VVFGANLKRERELRGITLDEISKATKISVRLLGAIETDRFDVLPSGIFRKSFIKSYAKYLGMNEEQILHEYALQFEISPLPTHAEKPTREPSATVTVNQRSWWVLLLGGLLLLAVCGGLYWLFSKDDTPEPSVPPSTSGAAGGHPIAASPVSGGNLPTSPGAARPTGEASTRPPGASASSSTLKVLGELDSKPGQPSRGGVQPLPGTALELTVQVTETSWLSVSSGERSLFSGLMNSPESKKFPLQSKLTLVLGNAGGVKLLVNGRALASLGKSGEVKTIEISAENYQQYLAPKIP
jgi:cytoskeleton protein RodZ